MRYRFESHHTVHATSYTEGEGKFTGNAWTQNAIIEADSTYEAVQTYFAKELFIEFEPDNCIIGEADEFIIETSKLVTVDGIEANQSEIDDWKQGKEELFDELISIKIDLLQPINVKKESEEYIKNRSLINK